MSEAGGAGGGETSGGGTVLLVDDQATLRRAIARRLAKVGHRVVEAADGAEAIAALDAQPVDVVLTDISMPNMDGLALLRAVRERDLDLPVVLVTGAPSIASASHAVAHGALDYLVKPVELDDIEKIVKRATSLYRIARAKREALELLGGARGWASDRAGLESSFARALEGLWIAYQPIVRAGGSALFGYEALMRSREPTLPHPGAVLDAAERLGKLRQLGRLLRDRTAAPIADASEGASIFVNLHADDLDDDTLVDPAAPLARHAHRVVLEVTERASLHGVSDVRARIAKLREVGYRIAIDDLGAGYAGLTSFADLEPDVVKLDMSLVRDVERTPTKQKLVRAMSAVCKDLGMMVVAEGVETVAERDALVELGCDLFQGYLFAKPGPAFPSWSWGS